MDSFYCKHCDVKLSSEENFDEHLKGKRHNMTMDKLYAREQAASRTVFVQNIQGVKEPGRLEKLKKYFSTFGEVKTVRFSAFAAFVVFEDNISPKNVLKCRNHKIDGVRLHTKKYEYRAPKDDGPIRQKQKREKEEGTSKQESLDQMMENIMSAKDVQEQLKILSEQQGLSKNDKSIRENICRTLEHTFSPYFQFCSVLQFGSSINGFGAVGCDLDLFIDFGEACPMSPSTDKETVDLPNSTYLDFWDIRERPLNPEQVANMTPMDMIKLLARLLSYNKREYSDVQSIPSNRCPVVKFIHKETHIKCDLSLNNRVSLMNSQLLRLYSQEPRVHELVTTIRQWATKQSLRVTPQYGHLLTSYALTWLVLFHLQNQEPPVIPKVTELVNCIPGAELVIQQDAECVSVPMDAKLPQSPNTTSSVELLKSFFEFYHSQVNFDTHVLLTRDVQIVAKTELNLDPLYKEVKPSFVTVMDPFILSHNVTKTVNERTKERLMAHIEKAVKLVENWPNCQRDDTTPWGLADLLQPRLDPLTPVAAPKSSHKKKKAAVRKMKDAGFSFEINAYENKLTDTALQEMSKSMNVPVYQLWCQLVQDMVPQVLAYVFFVRTTLGSVSLSQMGETCQTLGDEDAGPSNIKLRKSKIQQETNANCTAELCNPKVSASIDTDMEHTEEGCSHSSAKSQKRRLVITESDSGDDEDVSGPAHKRQREAETIKSAGDPLDSFCVETQPVEVKTIPELHLCCKVYLILWRDRVRVGKLLKSTKDLSGFHLEQAVSLHYLTEHVAAGSVPAELECLIRSERVISDKISRSECLNSSVTDDLIERVKFPKVDFSCHVKQLPKIFPTMMISMMLESSQPDDISFFKLFFDSFKTVFSCMVKKGVVR